MPLTDLIPLYLILTLVDLLYATIDARNAAQAEAQQKRWLAK